MPSVLSQTIGPSYGFRQRIDAGSSLQLHNARILHRVTKTSVMDQINQAGRRERMYPFTGFFRAPNFTAGKNASSRRFE